MENTENYLSLILKSFDLSVSKPETAQTILHILPWTTEQCHSTISVLCTIWFFVSVSVCEREMSICQYVNLFTYKYGHMQSGWNMMGEDSLINAHRH